jgi:transcriptional regulator with XRE-family HTH domain
MYRSVDRIVGRNLRRLREKRGVTQAALAARVEVSAQDLSAFETGALRIPAPVIYALATSLGVAISAFFEGFEADETGSPADTLTLH